jgi:hypothetical protein
MAGYLIRPLVNTSSSFRITTPGPRKMWCEVCPIIRQPQGKLVRVTAGVVFDVAVDLRKGSPTFGRWVGDILSAENRKQIWISEGFAHGFAVMSDHAEVLYKTTDYWSPKSERCLIWNDATLGIKWPIDGQPIISLRRARSDVAGCGNLCLTKCARSCCCSARQ